ncbi:MAG: RcnB family protein [Parvibaculum sp.]|nr:RcnB family protein [Parvibaculum sp.]
MKTAFAAALALSLLSGTAFAAPADMRGDQGQSRQDRGDRGDGQARDGQDRPNRGEQQGQQNNNQPRGNGSQQGGAQQSRPQQGGNQQGNNDRGGNDRRDNDRGDRGGYSDNQRGGNDRGDRGNDRHYGNNDRNGPRGYEYNGRRYNAVRGPAWHAPRGYDARRAWNRGDRLPIAYRNRAYVIDHRVYGLQRPPYGYQWVRVSNNVFLVNAHNGFISQIVFSMFY